MEYVIKSISRKGRFHVQNEDSFVVQDDYVVIADGIGGESSGEIASKLAVLAISTILNGRINKLSSKEDIKQLCIDAIKEADSHIAQYVSEHPDSYGMGTTVVLMVIKDDKLFVAWCGDSRCYLYAEDKLMALTKDHTYVQELIDDNKISIEESFTHPDNNLITKYVGGGEYYCMPEFTSCEITEGSTVVLCSDGLSGYCKNEDIEKIVSESPNDELPAQLYQMAVNRGSDDDITIITMTPKKKSSSLWSWFHSRKQ